MMTLSEIETLARDYAGERQKLVGLVTGLNRRLEAVKREALPEIKRAVGKTAGRESELRGAIDGARELFVEPRTVIFHGIKVGLEKGRGKIEVDDEAHTIRLIRKGLPEQADALIKTEEHVLKSALKWLTVAQLKAIGCTVEESGDQVVIRAADREVDKIVSALLRSAVEEEAKAAA